MQNELVIAPLGDTWKSKDSSEKAFQSLEQVLGSSLPADYRQFLLEYDGGSPYPLIFHFSLDEDDPERFLDRLHCCDRVKDLFLAKPFGDGIPFGMLIIGEDPGGLQVLISLKEEDFGRVYALYPVSEPPNSSLVFLAEDFRTFLGLLFETEERIGWEHWYTPRRKSQCRPLLLS